MLEASSDVSASKQSYMVDDLHRLPRFGHSNRISKLVSFHRGEQEDYVRGILGFCLFLCIVFYLWLLVMMVLKFAFPQHTGCAGGGQTVDVAALRKSRVPRHIRRRQIIRSWRVQWTFLVASVGIPIMTLLMARNGLKPLIHSLDEVESINDEVEDIAFRGLVIADSLVRERKKLQQNFTRRNLDMEDVCPNLSQTQSQNNNNNNQSTILAVLPPVNTVTQYIQVGLEEVGIFIDQHAPQAQVSLNNAASVTHRINHSIEWSYANDWILKFFLLTINVINGFLLFGVFLSKQDIVSHKYQRYLSYGLVPVFALLLVCSMLFACAFGIASMLNADFCYGNRSNTGTIAEVLSERGTATSDITYKAFVHYMEGCLNTSPLDYSLNLDPLIQYTMDAVNLLEEKFDTYTPEEINKNCASEIHGVVSGLPQLTAILREIQLQIRAAVELTGCHQISPVLRRILHGATCSETVDALTWLFCGMCVITILGFIMLTVRAGLYNAVVRAPRRKRKRERVKEFDEYKEFMAEFYEDAEQWSIDLTEKKKPASTETIPQIPTFETDETSKSDDKSDNDDDGHDGDGSDIAYMASPTKESVQSEDESSESSYESDYSSDSEEERSIMSTSIIGRFFHAQLHNDDAQSSILGMSMFGRDTDNQSVIHSQATILDLQTPRRRRKHSSLLPAPYAFADRSPNSHFSPGRMASPESKGTLTPVPPEKQRRAPFRTKRSTKES